MIGRSQVNWDDARLLLAVARSGQISSAASRLGMTQATVSRRIARLEDSLGVNLIVRLSHGTTLSDKGQSLIPMLEEAEAAFAEIQTTCSAEAADVTGTIRIGTPDGFGLSFLAHHLDALTNRYPSLQVQLVPTPRGISLSKREADIAVMVGRPEKGKLVRKKLTGYSLGLFASKEYLDRFGEPRTTDELRHHRLIGYVEDLVTSPSLNYMHEFSKDWRSSIEVYSSRGQLEAVAAGAGIGILHHFMAEGMKNLQPVLPKEKVIREYWIAWHETLNRSMALHATVQFLTELVTEKGREFWIPGS